MGRLRKVFIGFMLLMLASPAIAGLLQADGAFRNALIGANAFIRRALWDSGSDQVMIGRDGYLFFSDTMEDYYGRGSDADAVARVIGAYRDALAERGIGFTFICAPNKNSVYPERMPYYALQGAVMLPELTRRLNDLGVDTVDAYALLAAAKETAPVYHAADTHWNARGAYLVANEVLSRLGIVPETDAFEWAEVPFQGDLVRLYRPGQTAAAETDSAPVIRIRYRVAGVMRSVSDMRIETIGPSNGWNVLVQRDSFGEALFPYLANHLERMVFSRDMRMDADFAVREGAEHVLLIIAQRSLNTLITD
jgi:hypothetical protein